MGLVLPQDDLSVVRQRITREGFRVQLARELYLQCWRGNDTYREAAQDAVNAAEAFMRVIEGPGDGGPAEGGNGQGS